LATFLDALATPLLERVGTRWREGTLRPVHEHIVSAALRRILEGVIESTISPLAKANMVVGTPAGQGHEFGALLAAATAAAAGWDVTYLGADLPAEDIAEAATRTRARAVALSIVYPRADPALGDELRRLRTALPKDIALIVGGAASSAYGTPLEEIGAIRVEDLTQLRKHLKALRHARRRGRRTAA
jgi:methylmalonyl-CoA mutase cobalamin-binding subunit